MTSVVTLRLRKNIQDLCRSFKPSNATVEQAEFQAFLTDTFNQLKIEIETLVSNPPKPQHESEGIDQLSQPTRADQLASAQLSFYLKAAGLVTYGELDRVFDILDYLPHPEFYKLRSLGLGILVYLFPLPDKLVQTGSNRLDLDPIRGWLQENRVNLRWDAPEGKFILKSDPSI